MRTTIAAVIIWIVAGLCPACGSTEAAEKARRRSDRFYEAGYTTWFEEHDTLAAIRHLTRSIEADPENDRAHYLLGTLRLARGEYEEAEKHIAEAVRFRAEGNPAGLAEAQNGLGVVYIHTKRLKEAVEVLEKSADEVLNREPWLARGNLGWAHIELGEYDDAIETLRRAVFDQPKFCVGLYRLGQAYYLKGDYKNAEVALKRGVEVPEKGCDRLQDAHHLLGMTYLRLSRDAEAKSSFEICRDIDPSTETGSACQEVLAGL